MRSFKQDKLNVVAEKPVYIFTKKNEKRSVEFNFELKNNVNAPVKIGECIGELKMFENGVEIEAVNVLANENVDSKSYFDIIKDIGYNWAII